MKFIPIALVLVAFAPGCRCSKESDRDAAARFAAAAPTPLVETPSATPPPRQRAGKLPFWKISSTNATLFLLGSIQVSSGDFYPLPDRVERAFKASELLVLESGLDQATRVATMKKMAAASTYAPPETLSQNLSPPTQKQLELYQQRTNGPPDAFEGSRPWFVAATVYGAEVTRNGFQRDLEPDMHFYLRAIATRKNTEVLQSSDDAVKIYDELPATIQDLLLRQTLEALPSLGDRTRSANDAWNRGDLTALDWLLLGPLRTPDYEPLLTALFTRPNIELEKKLAGHLERPGTYFAVISTSHLVGKTGIVELFSDEKYSVEQQ